MIVAAGPAKAKHGHSFMQRGQCWLIVFDRFLHCAAPTRPVSYPPWVLRASPTHTARTSSQFVVVDGAPGLLPVEHGHDLASLVVDQQVGEVEVVVAQPELLLAAARQGSIARQHRVRVLGHQLPQFVHQLRPRGQRVSDLLRGPACVSRVSRTASVSVSDHGPEQSVRRWCSTLSAKLVKGPISGPSCTSSTSSISRLNAPNPRCPSHTPVLQLAIGLKNEARIGYHAHVGQEGGDATQLGHDLDQLHNVVSLGLRTECGPQLTIHMRGWSVGVMQSAQQTMRW